MKQNETVSVKLFNNAEKIMKETLHDDIEKINQTLIGENTNFLKEIISGGEPYTAYSTINTEIFTEVNNELTKTNYRFPSFLNLGKLKNWETQPTKMLDGKYFKTEIPFIFPMQGASIGFIQNEKYKLEINNIVETIGYKLMSCLPTELSRVILVDKLGSGQNIPNLIKLHDKFTSGKLLTNDENIEEAVEKLKEEISSVTNSINLSGFRNIEEYNRNTDEVPQPYNFLFIANFPKGFTRQAAESILSILEAGPRVGIYTIMTLNVNMKHGPTQPILGIPLADFLKKISVFEFSEKPHDYTRLKRIPHNINSVSIPIKEEDEFKEMVNGRYKIVFEDFNEQAIEDYTKILNEKIKNINIRPIIDITKTIPKDFWTMNANKGISVPFGKAGIENVYFSVGINEEGEDEGSHHVLIGGSTGSGKTVLLHDIILHSSMKYSPSDLHFWLLDYKEGTEFAIYKDFPHVQILSMESEIEFGQQVLQKALDEMKRRGNLFKEVGCGNLDCYNKKVIADGRPEDTMARIVILIDEFQALYPNNSPKVLERTDFLIDQVLRLGRSFGINLALATQTLKGVSMGPQLMSNLKQRIGLVMDKKDVSKIFTDNNHAVGALSFPGEGIYNKQFGQPANNKKFQAFLALENSVKHIQNLVIDKINETYNEEKVKSLYDSRFIYSGDLAGDKTKNPNYKTEREVFYIGESAGLSKEHISVNLQKDFAENFLMVGQDSLKALSITLELINQIEEDKNTKLYFSNFNKKSEKIFKEALGENKQYSNLDFKDAVNELHEELLRRKSMSIKDALSLESIYSLNFFIENSAVFSTDGSKRNPEMLKVEELIEEGSSYGIFVLLYTSSFNGLTKNGINRQLDKFKTKVVLMGGGNSIKILGEEGSSVEKSKSLNVAIIEKNIGGKPMIMKFKPYMAKDLEVN